MELNVEPLRWVKIVVAGEGGVGKTTLIKRFTTGTFIPNTMLTRGVERHISKIPEVRLALLIFDLGGEDRFRWLTPSLIRGASGVFLVFDLTRHQTFKNLSEWMDILQESAPNVPIILLGSKADLEDKIIVYKDAISEFCDKYNILKYFTVSAKTGESVKDAVFALAQVIDAHLSQFDLGLPPENRVFLSKKSRASPRPDIKSSMDAKSRPLSLPKPTRVPFVPKQSNPSSKPETKPPPDEIPTPPPRFLPPPSELKPGSTAIEPSTTGKNQDLSCQEVIWAAFSHMLNNRQAINWDELAILTRNVSTKDQEEASNNFRVIQPYLNQLEEEHLIELFTPIEGLYNRLSLMLATGLNLYLTAIHTDASKSISQKVLNIISDITQITEKFQNPFSRDFLANLYFLTGTIQFVNKDSKSGLAFLKAGGYYAKIKNLLAAKCFFLAASELAATDPSYGFNLFDQNADILEYLARANIDYTELSTEIEKIEEPDSIEAQEDNPLTYLLLAMRCFGAVDTVNQDREILSPLYNFVSSKKSRVNEDEFTLEAAKRFLTVIESSPNLPICNSQIVPEFPSADDPLTIMCTLINITNQFKQCIIALLAPRADLAKSQIKVRLEPKSTKDISFVIGRANSVGEVLYNFEVRDLEDFLISQKSFHAFIRDPKELLCFTQIDVGSTSIKQDESVTAKVRVENKGKTPVTCCIIVDPEIFAPNNRRSIIKLPPGEKEDRTFDLGLPSHAGEGKVHFLLTSENGTSIFDSKTILFVVKRSYWQSFKTVAAKVAKQVANYVIK